MPDNLPNPAHTLTQSKPPIEAIEVTQVREPQTHLLTPSGMPVVPGYVVAHEIARGGMGVVYAAHDPVFDREVAVKVMHRGQDAERFVIESKVTAQLPHPGVPPVYALGTLPDGRPFLAMKLIEGQTLADELKATDLPRLLGIFEQICQTVGFAHSRGIIHRDLKPANVMVGAFGEVQVMDWGLAKLVGGNQESEASEGASSGTGNGAFETVAGQVKGTPAYMAPEQARGEEVGPPADVFALGGILAVMLTGKPPFLGDTVLDTVLMAAQAELNECFAQFDACGADAELIAVAKRCLAPDAGARFSDGKAVAESVAAYRAGVEERLRQAERDRAVHEAEAREQRKRRKVQLALAASVLLMVVGIGAVAWWQDHQTTQRKAKAEREEAERQAEHERAEATRTATEARLEGERDAEARNKANQARDGVRANRALADDLRKQYKFKQADTALAQAAELAKGGAPRLLAEVEQARTDLAFVVHLDDIRYRKWVWIVEEGGDGHFNTAVAPPEYGKAFADRGLDLEVLAPADAAKRIAASAVKPDLIAAVDDWALYEPKEAVRNRLLEIARLADPDPWSDRLRDPVARLDKSAVANLAAEADPVTTPSAALSVLANLMERRGLNPVPLLLAARAKHPSNFDLAFALGQWHMFKAGDGLQVGPYEAARASRPESYPVWINLGSSLQKKGDLDGAIAAFRQAVTLEPKYAQARSHLGGALKAKGDVDGAIAVYREAIKIEPKYPHAHTGLGSALSAKGDVKGSLAAYQEALRLNPKSAYAHNSVAWQLSVGPDDVRDGRMAVELATRACELKAWAIPSHIDTLAAAYAETGQFEKAAETLKIALSFSDFEKQYGPAARQRLELYTRKKPYHVSVLTPREAAPAPREVTDPRVLRLWGNSLHNKGDFGGAIVMFTESLKHDPKSAYAHNGLGLALRVKGDVNGAIAAYQEAIRLDPKYAYAYTNLAIALRIKGDLDGAIAAYREAIKHDKGNAVAHQNLGWNLYYDKRDAEGAETHLRESVRLAPTTASFHNGLGCVLRDIGQLDEAFICFQTAIGLNPKYTDAVRNLGTMLERKGDFDAALAAYLKSLTIDPNYELVRGDLRRVLNKKAERVAPAPHEVNRP